MEKTIKNITNKYKNVRSKLEVITMVVFDRYTCYYYIKSEMCTLFDDPLFIQAYSYRN